MDVISAQEGLNKLLQGNKEYLAGKNGGDASASVRKANEKGQSPYAVVVACSDSRVIPEYIFSAGIGEIFVIRVAGNVVGPEEMGSIEYATSHLGARLVMILGHTNCGAVSATVDGGTHGYIKILTDKIKTAIGDERDKNAACIKNVRHVVKIIDEMSLPDVTTVGAIYDILSGEVTIIH